MLIRSLQYRIELFCLSIRRLIQFTKYNSRRLVQIVCFPNSFNFEFTMMNSQKLSGFYQFGQFLLEIYFIFQYRKPIYLSVESHIRRIDLF